MGLILILLNFNFSAFSTKNTAPLKSILIKEHSSLINVCDVSKEHVHREARGICGSKKMLKEVTRIWSGIYPTIFKMGNLSNVQWLSIP